MTDDRPITIPVWAIDEIYIYGVVVVFGGSLAGPQSLARALGPAFASRKPLAHVPSAAPQDVAYIDPKGSPSAELGLMYRALASHGYRVLSSQLPMERSPRGLSAIEMWAEKSPRPRLLILDSWRALDPTPIEEQQAAFDLLRALCRRHRFTALIFAEVDAGSWTPPPLGLADMSLRLEWDVDEEPVLRLHRAGRAVQRGKARGEDGREWVVEPTSS